MGPVEEVSMTADENKQEEREHKLFMNRLRKQFEDTQFKTGDELELPGGNSTGSLRLDINLGVPIYEGAIVEIYSDKGAGKTTLALSILAKAAEKGKKCLFLDQEQALQPTLVDSFPILRKPGRLEIITAPTGEEALRLAELWVRQYPGTIVVIDSVDALLPGQTESKDIGETDVGTLPKLMSAGCRKLQHAAGQTKSTVIFLNQMRAKIGAYGNPNTTSGGKALPYYAAQRIELMDITSKTRIMNDEGRQIGHIVRFKVEKNKVAPPFVSGEFPLIYGKGIDVYDELATLVGDLGLVEKDGKYYVVDGKKRPHKTFVDMLKSDPELFKTYMESVREAYPETFGE